MENEFELTEAVVNGETAEAAEENSEEINEANIETEFDFNVDFYVDLAENKKFKILKTELETLNDADIAELLDVLKREEAVIVFRMLKTERAASVFTYMEDTENQKLLIDALSDKELHDVLSEMFLDDAVDIIEDMPANVVTRMLKNTDAATRKQINTLLSYPEDSAGSIMTTEFVNLERNDTVEMAFARIRKVGVDKETIYTCYVTEHRKLLGVVTVKKLLLSPYEERISDIMETNIMAVNTNEDKEVVGQMFSRYDLSAIPVVDNNNRIVGIVTVDDAIDVIEDEVTEDIEKMAAILPTEKSYFQTGIFATWKSRIPWLLLLMVSATFTGMIISSFQSALAVYVVLTAYIPMLMDTGGNSGSQASVTIIRSIALGDVEFKDLPRVIWKEIRVAVVCGLTLAVINFVKLIVIDSMLLGNTDVTPVVCAVVCATMFITILCAKIVGCTLPLCAAKLGFDPAVMASPFITTIVDAISLLIYFQIARLLLGF